MNNEKLLELANKLIGDVAKQKITGISVDNTNYEDGSKHLSIVIDYVESSGTHFEIKAGKLNFQN